MENNSYLLHYASDTIIVVSS